jgi:hypothetical protein
MAIFALVALGGCGGSDDDSTATSASGADASVTVETASISKAEWAKQAGKICTEGLAPALGQVQKAIATGKGVEKVEAAVLPVVEGWIDELAALGAPKGEEAKVEAFLTALQGDLEEAQAKPSSSMEQLAKTFKESGDAARENGIETCALG